MARLTDLNPRWFAVAGRHGQGVSFDCPHCLAGADGVRLAVAFDKPLDGGAPVDLTPRALWPSLGLPGNTSTVPPGIHWARTGDTFESLTLAPSVDARASGHWHGFIQNGEVR